MGDASKIRKRRRKKKKVVLDHKSPGTYECYLLTDGFDDIADKEPIRLPIARQEYYSIEVEDL